MVWKIEQRFETALRDFGLIRRVGRVPARVFEHVAQDDAGGEAIGVAEADVGFENLIAGGDCAEFAQEFVLALAFGEVERVMETDPSAGWFDRSNHRVWMLRFA